MQGTRKFLEKAVNSEEFAKIQEFIKKIKYKKTTGVFLILYGFFALFTPFTPGAILCVFIGAELLGIRILFWEKIKARIVKNKHKNDSE
jgi:uncharacterized membrane protein HdeD (DUF308 family)